MKRDSLVPDTYSEGAFYPELDMAKSEPPIAAEHACVCASLLTLVPMLCLTIRYRFSRRCSHRVQATVVAVLSLLLIIAASFAVIRRLRPGLNCVRA